jgi:hypothetical protein
MNLRILLLLSMPLMMQMSPLCTRHRDATLSARPADCRRSEHHQSRRRATTDFTIPSNQRRARIAAALINLSSKEDAVPCQHDGIS